MQADKALVLVVLFAAVTAYQCGRAYRGEARCAGPRFHSRCLSQRFAATAAPVLRVSSGDSIHTATIDAAGPDEKVLQRRPWCRSDHRRWAHPNQMVINKSLRCVPCIDTQRTSHPPTRTHVFEPVGRFLCQFPAEDTIYSPQCEIDSSR